MTSARAFAVIGVVYASLFAGIEESSGRMSSRGLAVWQGNAPPGLFCVTILSKATAEVEAVGRLNDGAVRCG